MADLQWHELRGRVRSTLLQQLGSIPFPHDAESRTTAQEHVFNPDGKLILHRTIQPDGTSQSQEFRYDAAGQRLNPNIQTVHRPDGSRTEIHHISGVDTWTMKGLNDFGFGTAGAPIAETHSGADGLPIETIFRDELGHEFSRLLYTFDGAGNIVEAVQTRGTAPPPVWRPLLDRGLREFAAQAPPEQREIARALIEPGAEQARAAFRYDEVGRVVEVTAWLVGRQIMHTVETYNESGDLATSASDGQPQMRFEYEYDERGNWVRKTAFYTHGSEQLGSDEYRRTITYYTDP